MTTREFDRFVSMERAKELRRNVAEFLGGCVVGIVVLIVMACTWN